jgi:hypothetical protein
MTLSALKSSCVLAAAALLAIGTLAAPQMALAGAKADSCKAGKTVQKAKAHKAKIHKVKAKPAKTKTKTVAHKAAPKAKVIKVAATPCDCRRAVKVAKVIQPVVEREVTVYRAEPRRWHAPYVDEVTTGRYATYNEASRHEETRVVQRIYIRNDHYLTADTRPGRHRRTRWPRWME